MILYMILTALTCFIVFFLRAKRFKLKRLIISVVLSGIFSFVKSYSANIRDVGLTTILLRKISRLVHQPYYCKDGIVRYELNGKIYKIVLYPRSQQKSRIKCFDKPKYFILESKEGTGKREDVTSKLEPWIGPDHNFHNTTLTPSDLQYKKLMVYFSIGDKVIINENDPLPTNLLKL